MCIAERKLCRRKEQTPSTTPFPRVFTTRFHFERRCDLDVHVLYALPLSPSYTGDSFVQAIPCICEVRRASFCESYGKRFTCVYICMCLIYNEYIFVCVMYSASIAVAVGQLNQYATPGKPKCSVRGLPFLFCYVSWKLTGVSIVRPVYRAS